MKPVSNYTTTNVLVLAHSFIMILMVYVMHVRCLVRHVMHPVVLLVPVLHSTCRGRSVLMLVLICIPIMLPWCVRCVSRLVLLVHGLIPVSVVLIRIYTI